MQLHGYSTHGADEAIAAAEAFLAANGPRGDAKAAAAHSQEVLEELLGRARQHQSDVIEVIAGGDRVS